MGKGQKQVPKREKAGRLFCSYTFLIVRYGFEQGNRQMRLENVYPVL